MWLLVISLPLLIALATARYRGELCALWGRVLALRRRRGGVCVRSTHAFVFSGCTHGNARSVLESFDRYSDTHPSLSLGPQRGELLDVVVRRVAPQRVLELGTHCGYSSVRILRLLPPAGRLVTVELDPHTADAGEELIMVAGFKHSQFQVLTCSSAQAIPALRSHLGLEEGPSSLGLELVLMDHDPQQYLPDLLTLEREGLLRPAGCVFLFNGGHDPGGLTVLQDHLRTRPECYSVRGQAQGLMEVHYSNIHTKQLDRAEPS